jgi:acetylornithine deacetylase/succinyl-diaminopimelate desuccinylase family protein
MPLDLVNTLAELVAIPSVNPMGRRVSGPEYLEARVTAYLEALFARLGLRCQRQTVEPGRDNIVARLDGDRPVDEGGALVLFEAHQDTVPVVGMSIDPFGAVIRDGRMYGRGACDIKGGLAAMLAAVARLAEERPKGMPTIMMACTVNEEDGHSGAEALTRLWSKGDSLFPRRPDAAIVAEPTQLQAVVAHKGVVRWRCHSHGRATHSSQPSLGVNAIYPMGRVVLALERYHHEVLEPARRHPLCGGPTLSVGTVTGGVSVNTVPDRCMIEIDRRLIPGEHPDEAYRHVLDWIATAGDSGSIEHEDPFLCSSGLSDNANGALAQAMVAAAQAAGIDSKSIGVPYGTNASAIAGAGVPSIVFGPGSIDQAHTADEWVSLDQVAQASEALYQFGRAGSRR